MKRFRVGLLGFGCTVVAGGASADWHPAGQPPPAHIIPAGGEPAPLPAEVRLGTPARPEPPPLWFPAANRPEPAAVVPARLPLPGPKPDPRVGWAPQTVAAQDPGQLAPPRPLPPPMIAPDAAAPVVPAPAPAAPGLPAIPDVPAGDPPQPPPQPKSSDAPWSPVQPRPMVPPIPPSDALPPPKRLPDTTPPAMIPPDPPRSVVPAVPLAPHHEAGELPVAPPELMIPVGVPVPGKHGTFGSPPIRLSRDYPSLADLHGGSFRHGAGFVDGGDAIERGFVQGEYLMWWAKPFDIPILGTTSTTGGLGILGQPGTVPVIGPGQFIGPFRDGFRVRAGWWVDDCGSCALDGSFFYLGKKTANAVVNSDVFPTISRPIFVPNPLPPGAIPLGEFVESVALPGVLRGTLSARAESTIWGFDANVRKCLRRGCDWRSTWFAGYRNVNLTESLTVTENITVIGTNPRIPDPVGTVIFVQDRFAVRNHFHGGQLGGTYARDWGRVSLDARASVALGATHQELEISGVQVRTRPGMPPMTFSGGLLAAGPNLGTFTRNEFSVVPEVTVNVGYRLTPGLKAYVGYNFLFWSNVIRPADQIDRVVDLTFVPNSLPVPPSGLNRPQPLFKQSDLWITGIQFGLEWRW